MSKNETFQKAFDKIEGMGDIVALQKAHITPAEYNIIRHVLREFLKGATESVAFQKRVADWFAENGFHVVMDQHKVNYIISL